MKKLFCLVISTSILFNPGCGNVFNDSFGSGRNEGNAKSYPAPVFKTGQTKCYNSTGGEILCSGTGQDGEFRKGSGDPVTDRFTVDGSGGTVKDNMTGLVWLMDANYMENNNSTFDSDGTAGDGAVTWQHAIDYIDFLNSGAGTGGCKDWRLPNINELKSLANYGESNISTWLNTRFNNSTAANYWTSTTSASEPVYAWTLDLSAGGLYYKINSDNNPKTSGTRHVWPVRGSSSLQKTGAGPISGYTLVPGEDGTSRFGISWPSPRFYNNGNNTITDNLTGLVWSKDANLSNGYNPHMIAADANGQVKWQAALDYIKYLNEDLYLGYSDWRLPNINELESLTVNLGTADIKAWLENQGFSNVDAYYYWTSTTCEASRDHAWSINLSEPSIGPLGKEGWDVHLWPVRGGQ